MKRSAVLGVVFLCALAFAVSGGYADDADKPTCASILKEATNSAAKASSASVHARLLARIAEMQAATGDPKEAFKTVKQISDIHSQTAAFPMMAAAFAAKGDKQWTGSLDNADPELQAEIYSKVVIAISAHGKPEDAAAYIDKIQPETSERARAQSAVAQAWARAGDWDKASQTVEQIQGETTVKTEALVALAVLEAKAGKKDQATQTLQKAMDLASKADKYNTSSLWIIVADGMARMGNADGAKALVDKVTEQSYKDILLGHVATAQAQMGQVDEAIKTAAMSDNKVNKMTVGSAIAIAAQQAGDSAKAKQAVDDAVAAVKAMDMPAMAATFCKDIGQAYAKVNGLPAAAAWARSLPDPEMQVDAMLGIAQACPEYHDPLKP